MLLLVGCWCGISVTIQTKTLNIVVLIAMLNKVLS